MADTCINKASFDTRCFDNRDCSNLFNIQVGLYKREKSIFKRPTATYYVQVSNGIKSKQVEYHDIEGASYLFVQICTYWRILSEYRTIQAEIEREGYSHIFYKDSLDNTVDTMPLLRHGDLYSGLTPSTTGIKYNKSENSYSIFLLYCGKYTNELGRFAEQFKTIGLSLSSKDVNIAWKVTNNDVILCRYELIEDFDNIYNDQIMIIEELYKHPNPTKFRYIASQRLLTSLAHPILCSNPIYW